MKTTQSILSLTAALIVTPAFAQTDNVQKQFPALIQVAAGNSVVLETQAKGSIAYECSKERAPLTTYKWVMAGPDAVLMDKEGKEIGSYDGPPARWSLKDGSFVTGSQVAVSSNGSKNIPMQLVKADVAGGQGTLTTVGYVQRVNTKGGVAPQSKCSKDNEGEKVNVDYTADYVFWKAN